MQQNTALLVMDMQTAILASLPSPEGIINNVTKAIAKARENKVPVIYVAVGFRQGTPEISPDNKIFSANRERFAQIDMQEFIKIHPALAPLPDDISVVKRRISAFTGSDLEVVLRAKGIKHLVLTGVATSGVVLSTIREASDKDYGLTVLADCCADGDDEVHQLLITKLFPRQADVFNVDEWQ
jgi:nicotinamidase-related amidase